jgi:ADP-ribose pyrophosphatase YjhB (NUDIX family)
MEARLLVGIGTYCLIVSPEGELLLAKQEFEGVTEWGSFGGALEPGETIEECAIREMREETGLDVRLIRLLAVDENWSGGELKRLGFIFLAEPQPWPQEVRLESFQGRTRFLEHRWVTREEARQLLASPNSDAVWLELWLENRGEVLFRHHD